MAAFVTHQAVVIILLIQVYKSAGTLHLVIQESKATQVPFTRTLLYKLPILGLIMNQAYLHLAIQVK